MALRHRYASSRCRREGSAWDDRARPDETRCFDEVLLVLEGHMNLEIDTQVLSLRQGEVFVIPAGLPHLVDPSSDGTPVIID